MRSWLITITAAAFLLGGLHGCKSRQGAPTPPAIIVGGLEITQEMIEYRQKAIETNPQAGNPEMIAVVQLVQGYLAAKVVNTYGDHVSYASVNKYWAIQRKTMPPKVLEIAEAIPNKNFMLQTFVMPDFAVLAADEFFTLSNEPHQAEADRAMRILARLSADPKRFDEVANEEKLTPDRLWIGPNTLRSELSKTGGTLKPVTTSTLEGVQQGQAVTDTFSPDERAHAAEMYRALGSTRKGEMYPRALNAPDSFQIIKVEERRPDEAKIAILTVPKRSLDDWFWEQASHVPIEFNDHELGVRFLKEVPWGPRMLVRKDQYPEVFTPATR